MKSKRCARCGRFFRVGPWRQALTKYCTDKCRLMARRRQIRDSTRRTRATKEGAAAHREAERLRYYKNPERHRARAKANRLAKHQLYKAVARRRYEANYCDVDRYSAFRIRNRDTLLLWRWAQQIGPDVYENPLREMILGARDLRAALGAGFAGKGQRIKT